MGAANADPGCVSGKDVLLGLDQSPSDEEAARAQLKSAMDGVLSASICRRARNHVG